MWVTSGTSVPFPDNVITTSDSFSLAVCAFVSPDVVVERRLDCSVVVGSVDGVLSSFGVPYMTSGSFSAFEVFVVCVEDGVSTSPSEGSVPSISSLSGELLSVLVSTSTDGAVVEKVGRIV